MKCTFSRRQLFTLATRRCVCFQPAAAVNQGTFTVTGHGHRAPPALTTAIAKDAAH